MVFFEKYGELSLNYLGYHLLSRALMTGHKICFFEKYGELSLNYLGYPFLSRALILVFSA